MSNLFLIVQREYYERIRKKSFLITTILMPIFLVGMMLIPALIMNYSKPDHMKLALVDPRGTLPGELQPTEIYEFVSINQEPDSAVARNIIDGYLVIPEDLMTNPRPTIRLLMNGAIPLELQSSLQRQLKDIVETRKLQNYNINDLPKILESVHTDISVNEVRMDKEDDGSYSSGLSYVIGIFMALILYMFILMYGQMVMTSIIAEKNNRVLELVVSSVKPMQLMMGKIAGIGLVAITQIIIWGIIMGFVASIALPSIVSADVSQQVAQLRAGTLDTSSVSDLDTLSALSMFTNVGFIIQIFCWLILFLAGGFLLYAAMFAAVGSSVDNVQDASQLQTFILIPIIVSLVFSTSVGNAPNSDLAIWLSMIPFTSPMVMMSRIPMGIAAWQPWVSIAILYASFIFMVWFAGKIYRIGIFMYGKKPNIRDLIKWAKYK